MIVYIYTFPNGKRYIGQTIQTLERRAGANGINYKECPAVYRAIQKYGWDNVKKEIFECKSELEMDEKEKQLIALYNTMDPNYGYNLESGGHDGKHLSESTKQKLREAHIGTHLSEETKRKISSSLKDHYSSPLGDKTKNKIQESSKKNWSNKEYRDKMSEILRERWKNESYREKMSEAHSGEKNGMYGKHHSEDSRQKMSKNSGNAKQVKCVETEKIYRSAAEASRQTGACDSAIRNVCNNRPRCKTAGGYHWEWV